MWRLLAAALLVSLAVPASVQAAPSPQGITVEPAIMQITLPSGSSPVHLAVRLTNNTLSPVTLALSAEDFTYLSQNGALRFVPPDSAATGAHGLAAAIQFDQELVLLAPGQAASVQFQIVHPNLLAPGGHYVAILYQEVNPTTSGGISIGLKPAVATLLFAATNGYGSMDVRLTTPIVDNLVASLPSLVNLVFTNTGNTQTSVHGIVQLVAPGGQVIAQGVINVNSGLILPAAERLFNVPLNQLSSGPRWPGIYQLRVQYRHDGQGSYTRYTESFVYVDGWIMGILVLVVLTSVLVILRRFGPGRRYLLRRKN